jgi:hypothetical protein
MFIAKDEEELPSKGIEGDKTFTSRRDETFNNRADQAMVASMSRFNKTRK